MKPIVRNPEGVRVAYDLDGVLAASPPPAPQKWGRMRGPERAARLAQLKAHYAAARVVYRPTGPFFVITARSGRDLEVKAISYQWLADNFGEQCRGLFMLPVARTVENVARFKVRMLAGLGFPDFYEDNPVVVRRMQRCILEYQGSPETIHLFQPELEGAHGEP